MSWLFISIMALHVLFQRWTYDEFVHSTKVTAWKWPLLHPSHLSAAAATMTKQQKTEECWKRWDGTYIVQEAQGRCWHKARRSLITYGLKHKQEIFIVFDHKQGGEGGGRNNRQKNPKIAVFFAYLSVKNLLMEAVDLQKLNTCI